ncbi:MAG: hypothetical protein OQK04_19330 [Kangiellaceae bacterium]|nr:hypothetical protein [Kangiellaceae bacterium]MCW9000872.1 hypothetical protein [Kangiellaceae bacterium]
MKKYQRGDSVFDWLFGIALIGFILWGAFHYWVGVWKNDKKLTHGRR